MQIGIRRPHRWQHPKPGDTALICARCGRRLNLTTLAHDHARRMGIIKARKRLFGREKGEAFAADLAAAMNANTGREAVESM